MSSRVLARTAFLLMCSVLLAGCSNAQVTGVDYNEDADASDYSFALSQASFDVENPGAFESTASFADGRKISVRYTAKGDALVEQHYSPVEQKWTAPAVIYTSKAIVPCAPVVVVPEGDVVAFSAGFAASCDEGKGQRPDAVAGVSSGDLSEWDVNISPGVEGWDSISYERDVLFWVRGETSVTWTDGRGFVLK